MDLRQHDGVAVSGRPRVLIDMPRRSWLRTAARAALLLGAGGCVASEELTPIEYVCETAPLATGSAGSSACGAGDPNLPPEPSLPSEVCQTLKATKSGPEENDLDTERLQAAFNACKGKVVKLVSDGSKNSFVAANLTLDSTTLWIDSGTTLYASRNAELYQKTGSCGKIGVNDSGACKDFISVQGTSPAIVGDGAIDGQGGEPLVGHDYSWWQVSEALRDINGSMGNPTMINLASKTTGFVLYRIHLYNAAKFHVKLTSVPADGTCTTPGEGFIVWGVTVLTPSRWFNSQGLQLTPHSARNTDGIDPGTTDNATCGVMACNTISTGDDQIAIKGGHWVSDLIIAHNRFGTGHGMSIGSETYGEFTTADGVKHRGVEHVQIYDLTIDADSRPVGDGSDPADSNGLRIKSDASRGGQVDDITFRDICMRDTANAILVSTAYNPLFAGKLFPDFKRLNFQNVRHVTCMGTRQPVVTLEGWNETKRAGPITLDNVVIDNIGPQAVAAEYADIVMGPGKSNFVPSGYQVTLRDETRGESAPRACSFTKLPAPEEPPGWLR
ncbi:MAG TPA: glycosyl hydrolase family 28 protein [Polyangiales bacterium]|nr:glycosyl hydrolase family 28 protein [Polyangiales bacterium]